MWRQLSGGGDETHRGDEKYVEREIVDLSVLR